VRERAPYLFGPVSPPRADATRDRGQMMLFQQSEGLASPASGGADAPDLGRTMLDRVHQAMILYSHGRSTQLGNFLRRAGQDGDGFWRLAQALSALYPAASDEKRLVDGVLLRRKMVTG
jgi:putative DNA methylase